MKNVMTVFFYELRRNVRRKGYLFTTFGIPLLAFALLFGYNVITDLNAQNADSDQEQQVDELDFGTIQKAVYVDNSGLFSEGSDRLSGFISPVADETTAREMVEAGDADVYYVISADYLESGAVTVYMPELSLGQIGTAETLIEQLAYDVLGKEVSQVELARLQSPANIKEFNLQRDSEAVQDEGADVAIAYIFVVVFFVAILVTNGYLMQSVIEEKETRLIEILIATVRPAQLLMGKVVAMSLLGLVQIVVWIIALFVLFAVAVDLPAFAETFVANIRLPVDKLPVIFVFFVLGYLFLAAAYAGVGAISNSMREGPQYAAIFMIPVLIPYYFVPAFVETPNEGLPQILSIIPLTSPLSMTLRVTLSSVPIGEILLSIGLMLLAVIGMVWLAGRMFRVQTLLSGQVPKLREIPKLLFGS